MVRRKRANPEQAIQRAIVQHLRARGAPGMFWFAIPNGGWRSPSEAAIMSSTGTRPGVPDLCFIHQGKSYFMEVKTPGGRVSPRQSECLELLQLAGAACHVAVGLDSALKQLENWQLLKGRTT